MFKFLRNWVLLSVLWVVLTLLWHTVIFAGPYTAHLSTIARYVDGVPTPLISYFIFAHVLVALGYVMFLPAVSRSTGKYVWNGVIMGWMTFAMFAILSHALFAGWGVWLMAMDVSFGTIGGAITGWTMKYLS